MGKDRNEFDLSSFMVDSLCLNDNNSPHVKYQYRNFKEHPVDKILRKDPRDVLGLNNIGTPRQIPESVVGTTIQEFYRGMNIFVTGGSGFLGKILIEKLIRSIPHLGQIYVLMRAKKGVTAQERFDELLENQVFLRMKTEVPDYRSKLTCVEGDISEPELGLSETDRQTLQSLVHIVFHSAADVRFINSLRAAINSNLVGSKKVIDLAKGMKNLKSYIHVSTAFSNCVRRVIEEKVYTPSVTVPEIMKLLEEQSDDEIKEEEDRILQGWPNTYTFSKALCEDMLSEEAKDLPLCIFRPSVVGPTYFEPFKGWTDNIYGPVGLMLAIGLGVVHMVKIETSLNHDLVPVDFTVNAMIAVAWENATNRIDYLPVYNFTSSPRNQVTWKSFIDAHQRWDHAYPFQQAIWYTSLFLTTNEFLANMAEIFLHKIPGHIMDKIAVVTGHEPRLTKVYNKLSQLSEKLDYFIFGSWEFRNDNTENLMNKLSKKDKELFFYDMSAVNAADYLLISRLGVKYFYLKESLDTMSSAERKWSWLKGMHYCLLTVSSLAALKLLVMLAHILPI